MTPLSSKTFLENIKLQDETKKGSDLTRIIYIKKYSRGSQKTTKMCSLTLLMVAWEEGIALIFT